MTETTSAGEPEPNRPEPPLAGDEVATLLGFLAHQRATFAWKTQGLDDDQLRAALPPTSMTLAGMLSHLAWVEDFWFVNVVSEQPMPPPWADADWDADHDWEWSFAQGRTGEQLRALWRERVANAEAVVATALASVEADPLAVTHPAWGGRARPSLRWVLVHLIEEYARHNGHADLLRESIDGATGQ